MTSDLCYISAVDAIKAFRARRLSPVELVSAVIARAEKANPKLNAFTYTFFDRALEAAKRAEARYRKRGSRPRRLEGLPVVIKDDHEVKGEITTHGSHLYADNVDDHSALSVERILRAGAIMIGRTTTPEFAAATVCHTPLWGVTRNPWNRRFTPGGSSGGSAAAVAAGMTTLADGADYAGSVRIPASACGVFGFKPPTGRIPSLPPWNLNSPAVFGPITRGVADGALMENVMAGPHPADIAALDRKLSIPTKLKPIKGWKIAYSIDLGYCEVHPDVRRNTRAALDAFRELGCQVDEVELGWTWDTLVAFYAHAREYSYFDPRDLPARQRKLLAEYSRGRVSRLVRSRPMSFAQCIEQRSGMYRRLGPVLERYDVFLCPTLAVPSVAAKHMPDDTSFTINGKKIEAALGWVMTYPFNLLPQLPVASVPSGFARTGVPTGLQIVGRPFDDVSVFRAAAAYERARPWSGQRPRL